MEQKLVSILTPCYNSTGFVSKLLNSILKQDYTHIEVLLIDDGSSDQLDDFLEENHWFEKFRTNGYTLRYFKQENQGQSVALNTGLKNYHGEYITWPDSDDYYRSSTVISTFVNHLEKHHTDVVRCYPQHVDENGSNIDTIMPENIEDGNIFLDCLFESDFWFSPICYFFKADSIKKILNDQIVESRVGQNFQFYIPIFYFCKVSTIRQKLVHYVVRKNSHSHQRRNVNSSLTRLNDILELKYTLLKNYKIDLKPFILRRLKNQNNQSSIKLLLDENCFWRATKYAIVKAKYDSQTYIIFGKYFLKNTGITKKISKI